MKKIPLRKCIATNEMLPKEELLRIVKSKDGTISIDLTNKKDGRGAYIKKDINVLPILKKKKILNRVFETQIDETLYEEIEKVLRRE